MTNDARSLNRKTGEEVPDAQGISSSPLERVHEWLRDRVQAHAIRAASLAIVRDGTLLDRWAAGWRAEPQASSRVDPGTRFLVASLTKPVTAAAAMRLVEDGTVALSTPVVDILPEFGGHGRDAIQVQHLLTHTSGLPDMVADNEALRSRQAGLDQFYISVCNTNLLFQPGTQTRYQSMGFLVLATMAERLTGMTFREFVGREILEPTGMLDSCLGVSGDGRETLDAQVELPIGQRDTVWHWNTRYWRDLGAPWGGLISTATDLAKFLCLFLHDERGFTGRRVLCPRTLEIMTRDWSTASASGCGRWGLGWMLRGAIIPDQLPSKPAAVPRDSTGVTTSVDVAFDRGFMGDLVSSQAFGHPGATGCMMWADPPSRLAVVVLTSSPECMYDTTFRQISNFIASCVDCSGEGFSSRPFT